MQAAGQGDIQSIVLLSSPHELEHPSIQNGDAVHHKVVPAGQRVVEASGRIHGEASIQ